MRWVAGVLLSTTITTAQSLEVTVRVLDGRNEKPLADQHVLVFLGLSSDAVKTRAQHTGGDDWQRRSGTLTIYPGETQWLQVFTDGHVPCFPNPNQAGFSVSDIMSKGLVMPNDCSAQVQQASSRHFTVREPWVLVDNQVFMFNPSSPTSGTLHLGESNPYTGGLVDHTKQVINNQLGTHF